MDGGAGPGGPVERLCFHRPANAQATRTQGQAHWWALEVSRGLGSRIRGGRGDAMPEQFRIGKWFLDKRPNSPSWCVCWFDSATRQTRRSSLSTEDFQVAKTRLAEHVTRHQMLKKVDPDEVLLEVILIRYWEEHGSRIPSAEQARFALGKWS